MKLLKIMLPNKEERIVSAHNVQADMYVQHHVDSLGCDDDNEEQFETYVSRTPIEVIGVYYAHLNVSKISWTSDGQDVYAYSLVILDRNGDVVGMMADTESAPYYYDEEKVAGDVNIIRMATDIINKESL